jgi:hypothetical protein
VVVQVHSQAFDSEVAAMKQGTEAGILSVAAAEADSNHTAWRCSEVARLFTTT